MMTPGAGFHPGYPLVLSIAVMVPSTFLLTLIFLRFRRDKVCAEKILHTIGLGVAAVNDGGPGEPLHISFLNPEAERVFTSGGRGIQGRPFVPWEFEEVVRQSLADGVPAALDVPIGTGDEVRWFKVRTVVLEETVILSFVDNTERKKNEETLHASERSLRLAARMAKIGMWAVEYPERRIVWSEEVRRIHGVLPGHEPEIQAAVEFYPPGSREKIMRCLADCETTGKPFDEELEFCDVQGRTLWVRAIGEAETDPETGSLTRILGTFQDLTETREAALALAESRELLSVAFWGGGMSISDWRISTGTVVLDANLLALLGYSESEVQPTLEFWNSLIHPGDLAEIDQVQEDYFAGKTSFFEAEYRMRASDGTYRWVLERTKIVEVTAPDNRPERLVGVLIDVTSIKEAESRLADALEKEKMLTRAAEAAVRAKREFLAMMSHEIRTPMNSILGFAELLAEGKLAAEYDDYVQTIRQSGESLLRIINDILDYSRIESGRLHIEEHPFSLPETLQGVVDLFLPQARAKGLDLRVRGLEVLQGEVSGDSGRLQQVLVNLLGNALKFTQRGLVTLSASVEPDERLRFSVEDTGPGISPQQIALIFEPFTQADVSISRMHGGTGLGLAISRQLVRLMGGELHLHSELGKGSVFSFTLHLPRASTRSPVQDQLPLKPGPEFAIAHPLKILIAEDDRVNARLVRHIIEQLGYSPVVVADGRAAVEAAAACPPDLILMDLRMPRMDGIEATRAIRQIERNDHGHLRSMIVAVTADALFEARSASAEAGMDDYVAKPVSPKKILQILQAAVFRSNRGEITPKQASQQVAGEP